MSWQSDLEDLAGILEDYASRINETADDIRNTFKDIEKEISDAEELGFDNGYEQARKEFDKED